MESLVCDHAASGSSPHTRGAQDRPKGQGDGRRIIPAYAGSTGPGVFDPPRGRDHPRIRGEHWATQETTLVMAGSSPHTRGAPGIVSNRERGERIIPAYAGSTAARSSPRRLWRNHPRIRGEHRCRRGRDRGAAGSSPHTRGAHVIGAGGAPASGIIPAYAGSTALCCRILTASADHPRIRGEHFTIEWEVRTGRGSSPHTRGAPASARRASPGRGIIPAYAGSTTL